MSRAWFVAIILFACGGIPACASASQTVKLHAGFSPDRLGASTTIMVGFDIGTVSGQVPSPLTDFDLSLPRGVGFGTTTLGEQVCLAKVLEGPGPPDCPSNSIMGRGEALVEVQIGPEITQEPITLEIFMGAATDHHTSLLFYADGNSPISAQLLFPGVLLADSGLFGAHLNTVVPLTPSVPEAPDATVVWMKSSLGPQELIYYKHVRGKLVGYQPIGMAVPEKCPRGGFPFSATFTFQDGTSASSSSTVPCPPTKHRRRGQT